MNAEQYQMASDGLLAAVFAAKGLLVPTPLCNSALDSLGDFYSQNAKCFILRMAVLFSHSLITLLQIRQPSEKLAV